MRGIALSLAIVGPLCGCAGSNVVQAPSLSAPREPTTAERQPAAAYTILYSFKGGTDAANPMAGLTIVPNHHDKLFGTSVSGGGGHNDGAVFEITTSGGEKVLHSFNKSEPSAALTVVKGTLYGDTLLGGSSYCHLGCGVLFDITPSGHETTLYDFKGDPDGADPGAALLAVGSDLYGTTESGGGGCGSVCGAGTVFRVTLRGNETVLHRFAGTPDGATPLGELADVGDVLYGTTYYGGKYGLGTVYSITTSGKERVIYNFTGHTDGAYPATGLVVVNNVLYGVTLNGGEEFGRCGQGGSHGGCGTIFEITPRGKEHVLYRFTGPPDGSQPRGLTFFHGAFYGTTVCGGGTLCQKGTVNPCLASNTACGTVFKFELSGKESVLHRFGGAPDGSQPMDRLVVLNGLLYGTTFGGGASNGGIVFRVSP